MTLPKWIEPKVTFGNILTIITLLGGLLAFAQTYGAQTERLDTVITNVSDIRVNDIPELRKADTELRQANVAQDTVAAADRLSTRETLAEMKTDLGYIRRYVEDERRAGRQ